MTVSLHQSLNQSPVVRFGESANILAGRAASAKVARMTDGFLGLAGKVGNPEALAHSNWFVAKARRMAASLLGYDFVDVRQLGRFKVVDPPFGAVLYLLYPVTMGARYVKAFLRDRKNNTDVEKGDVLRRDGTSITLFLLAVPPLKNFLTWINQKRSGFQLSESAGKGRVFGPAYGYQKMTDCLTFDRPQVLEAMIVDGNGPGVEKALKRLHKYYRLVLQKNGLASDEQDILNKIEQAQQKVSQALQEQKISGRRRTPVITALTQEAFDALGEAQKSFGNLKSLVGRSEDFNKMFKPAHRLLRGLNMKDAVADFTKMKRMPADLVAFLTVVFALGWFPVWFNDLLSRKRREQKATEAMTQNIMLSAPPKSIQPSPFRLVKP